MKDLLTSPINKVGRGFHTEIVNKFIHSFSLGVLVFNSWTLLWIFKLACEHWYQSLTLSADTWELDFNLLEKLRRKWDSVEAKHESRYAFTD